MDDLVEKMIQKANWLKAVSLSPNSGSHQEAELFIAAAKRIKELEINQKGILERVKYSLEKLGKEATLILVEQDLKG